MQEIVFTEEDLTLIRSRGMDPQDVLEQTKSIKEGFPRAELDRACTQGDGILVLGQEEIERLTEAYDEAAMSGRAMKFVPASGAATRMFQLLQTARNRPNGLRAEVIEREARDGIEESVQLRAFFRELKSLAFFDVLKSVMAEKGNDAEARLAEGRYEDILECMLGPEGLNASHLPKGLIPFHAYPDGTRRTPLEEHLVEGSLTVRDERGRVRVHFTASPEHENDMRAHLEEKKALYEVPGTGFDLDVSIQMPHTDTIALDMDGRPFRDDDGRLLFRPGGHGALLENLILLEGDIVFVKNIDNIVPDRMKEATVVYKKALGGLIVTLQREVFRHINALTGKGTSKETLDRAWAFALERLFVVPPSSVLEASEEERRAFLISRLNRPIRVCGMVRNTGEPGGGPFWVRQEDGSVSPQIVESNQVDMDSASQRAVWNSSTHFNPVDLVCALRDAEGRAFDLRKYRDPKTGFVSTKSWGGRELRAMELPGLWNGAMARWNSVFVEVPIETFNPVKTVLDLLRDEHRIT